MGRYAIVGDSYAVLDSEHGHWAKFWADNNNHQLDFFGLEGSNLVNIAQIVERLDYTLYDGVIFHYTSPLRAEGSMYPDSQNNKIPVVAQMADIYSIENKKFFEHVMTKDVVSPLAINVLPDKIEHRYFYDDGVSFITDFYNLMPHWFDYFNSIDENTSSFDATMTDICNRFYGSISIRWLVRANFMAYRNAVLTLNSKGIKNVTVFPTCGGFEQTINFILKNYPETKIWDQTKIFSIHPSETESRNHIPKERAQLLAQHFSFE